MINEVFGAAFSQLLIVRYFAPENVHTVVFPPKGFKFAAKFGCAHSCSHRAWLSVGRYGRNSSNGSDGSATSIKPLLLIPIIFKLFLEQWNHRNHWNQCSMRMIASPATAVDLQKASAAILLVHCESVRRWRSSSAHSFGGCAHGLLHLRF